MEKKWPYTNKLQNINNFKLFTKVAVSYTATLIFDVGSQCQSAIDFNESKVGIASVKEMLAKIN